MVKPRLVAPLCIVVMDDGSEFEVQSTNWDLLSHERYARAHKWPNAHEAPMEAATFTAWHALRREALVPQELTYDQFVTAAVSIETRAVAVDPTQPDPEDG
jgi:hypothetical protein